MPRKLGPKLILSLTILIVAISGVSGYLNFRTQKKQLVGTMILGADEVSRSITGATWHAMLDDDRKAAYEIMRVIADKQGIDRIRMFNREGALGANLKEYFPQALELTSGNLSSRLACNLLLKWPTFADFQQAKPSTVKSFYYGHNVRSPEVLEIGRASTRE